MAQKDLIDISTREDFKEITSKGGSRKTEKKTQAQRDRRKLEKIKKMSKEELEDKALTLATNPKATAIEIMQMITILKEKGDLKPETEVQLIRALSDAYAKVFGSKVFSFNVHKSVDSAKNMTKLYQICQQEKQEQEKEEDDDEEDSEEDDE